MTDTESAVIVVMTGTTIGVRDGFSTTIDSSFCCCCSLDNSDGLSFVDENTESFIRCWLVKCFMGFRMVLVDVNVVNACTCRTPLLFWNVNSCCRIKTPTTKNACSANNRINKIILKKPTLPLPRACCILRWDLL